MEYECKFSSWWFLFANTAMLATEDALSACHSIMRESNLVRVLCFSTFTLKQHWLPWSYGIKRVEGISDL